MIYETAQQWHDADRKKVLLFGMSGLGKTHISNMLRDEGAWFHYSVDYRIGTRYMGEYIVDNFKREAMRQPLLRELLRSDSIYIASNITFDNLAPLSTYLGKPGDPAKGGLSFDEYKRRQAQHLEAEQAALLDTVRFIDRAQDLYGYQHFVCDSGGSICEVVNPDNADDPILKALSDNLLLVWIKGSDDHRADLVRRFDKAPKPIYYRPHFLDEKWNAYLSDNNLVEGEVDPDTFIRHTYAEVIAHRQPRYAAMASWGVTVTAEDVAKATTPEAFDAMIAAALEAR
ncbi:MAG: ATPase [Pseudomonadota bacterium]